MVENEGVEAEFILGKARARQCVSVQWFPVVIMLTSHQMESANSSNSPRVIIQGVATSSLVAGWSSDC